MQEAKKSAILPVQYTFMISTIAEIMKLRNLKLKDLIWYVRKS